MQWNRVSFIDAGFLNCPDKILSGADTKAKLSLKQFSYLGLNRSCTPCANTQYYFSTVTGNWRVPQVIMFCHIHTNFHKVFTVQRVSSWKSLRHIWYIFNSQSSSVIITVSVSALRLMFLLEEEEEQKSEEQNISNSPLRPGGINAP